jgi:pSer/pThr/pTyr-binding forkhead associated (FHA) protein
MDPRPNLPPEGSLPAEIDLDRTDELPVLDVRAYEAAAHDPLAETSVQPALSVEEAVAEPRAGAEDPLQTAVANLREAQELLAAAELRAGQLTQELTATRAAAGQREAERGEELERARAAAGQQASDLAEELAAAHEASEQLRTRATTYFESLQSAERRRSLLEGLLSDLHDEIDARDSGHARVTRELAGRDVRAGELESDLSERAARIADLDGQVATLGAALRQRDVEHESALSEARNHRATLEAELTAERGGGEGRAQELARLRGEAQESAGALRAAQLECSGHLASIAAGEARVKQLEDRMAEQVQMRRTLQTAADAAVARAHELEADVRAAEENIARLESQLRGRDARVAELEKANQQWRHTLDDKRAAHAATHPAPREAAHAEAGAVAREPAPEGAKRLLISREDGREVVHVLGRKTTIGRTAENDLQIDLKHISRHHAVILAGPAHTIIEDLNSTNGVMVNGRRITRQILNDGDRVTIARTEYRFALRRNGEKR